MVALLALLSSQLAVAAPEYQGGGAVHYVTWGESLSGIASQYGVSMAAIMQANGITNPNMIYIGQPLVIPGGSGGYGGPPGGQAGVACASYHTVMVGDTLSGIAWQYNTTIPQLLQANSLYNKDVLYVGQRICIAGGGYAPAPSNPGYTAQPASYSSGSIYYHTVSAGETLSGIAYRYGVNHWKIMQANNLGNAVIWVGQQLIIPGHQGHQSPAPPPPPAYPEAPAHHPSRPVYEGGYHEKPVYQDDNVYHEEEVIVVKDFGEEDTNAPAAPDYQPYPAQPEKPRSDHPVEVVVNGGENWVDETWPPKPDPNGITTLIVQTGEENGVTVRLRSGDNEYKGESTLNPEFGAHRFVFRYIPPGEYDVWIEDPDTPSEVRPVVVNAGERVEMAFRRGVSFQGQTFASPSGWVLSEWDNPSKPGQNIGGWSNIMVHTPASGLNVMIESEGGGYKAKCFTGSKGPGSCDFAGLMAGIYYIWIDGTDLRLKTYMDGDAYATFRFAQQ
jgi:LysM repeat protein